jgi:hypothetical protein
VSKPASNTPQHERNWAIWRSHFVGGEMKSALSRRYGLTISRISDILSKASRSTMHCIYWPNRTPKERLRIVTTALEGIELIFPNDDRHYMRMPDGREFYFGGERKETEQ